MPEQVEEYKKLLKKRMRHDHRGDPIIPKYFYVPRESADYEKLEPGSQLRQASEEGSSDNLFLWGQSLYIIASLLAEGLVHVNELDLIRRYLPSYNRPRKMGGRYSAFQVISYSLFPAVNNYLDNEQIRLMHFLYRIISTSKMTSFNKLLPKQCAHQLLMMLARLGHFFAVL